MLKNRKYTMGILALILIFSINVLLNKSKVSDLIMGDRQTDIIYFSEKFYHQNLKSANQQHDYEYILNTDTDEVCKESKKLTLVALVASDAYSFERREAIRKTWANTELFPGMETVFIIGKSSNKTINQMLASESKTFGDIAQLDFMDTNKNLTLKTVMAMKWAAEFCNSTKFFLKVNDDKLVNSYALLPFLEDYPQPVSKSLFCLEEMHGKVDRNVESKFYMSENDVPNEYYPLYCNGGAYLMSPDMPLKLYTTSLFTKFFPFENIYVGILIEILDARIVSLRRHYCWSEANCFYGLHRQIEEIFFYFLEGITPQRMLDGWIEITENMMEVFSGVEIERKFL